MALPNFLLIGAEKAGTTTLAAVLESHPEIFMCEPKEPRFFSHHWERGVEWYETLFRGAGGHKAVGEASPSYTCSVGPSRIPSRIASTLEEVRFLYSVRNPIDRLVSHYRHGIRYGWFPATTSLEEAVEQCPLLTEGSQYHGQLDQFRPYFEPSLWRILVFEDWTANPESLRSAFEFLGVDRAHPISLMCRNATPEKPLYGPWLNRCSGAFRRRFPTARCPGGLRRGLEFWARALRRPIPDPEISPAFREQLIATFRPGVDRLSALCGRDLGKFWGLVTSPPEAVQDPIGRSPQARGPAQATAEVWSGHSHNALVASRTATITTRADLANARINDNAVG
jgi:hypothetical protein